jgi:hypothetical protein
VRPAAALRKSWCGNKHDHNDCGQHFHGTILRPFEFLGPGSHRWRVTASSSRIGDLTKLRAPSHSKIKNANTADYFL